MSTKVIPNRQQAEKLSVCKKNLIHKCETRVMLLMSLLRQINDIRMVSIRDRVLKNENFDV